MFESTIVNNVVGGKSFHQNVSYLTVEVEGKEMPFFFLSEYLQHAGDQGDSFQRCVLEDILRGKAFPDTEPEMETGNVARNFDSRTDIRDTGTAGLRDVEILVSTATYVTFNFEGCVEISILLHRLQIKYTVHALSFFLLCYAFRS